MGVYESVGVGVGVGETISGDGCFTDFGLIGRMMQFSGWSSLQILVQQVKCHSAWSSIFWLKRWERFKEAGSKEGKRKKKGNWETRLVN